MISQHKKVYIPVDRVQNFRAYLTKKSIRTRLCDGCYFEVKTKTGWKALRLPLPESNQISCKGALGNIAFEFMQGTV
jgi:hypothetical protein